MRKETECENSQVAAYMRPRYSVRAEELALRKLVTTARLRVAQRAMQDQMLRVASTLAVSARLHHAALRASYQDLHRCYQAAALFHQSRPPLKLLRLQYSEN